jgi:uncharacterized protein (TIRG00374 family)
MTKDGRTDAPQRKSRNPVLALRLGVTALCCVALFFVVDPSEIWGYFSRITGKNLAAAILLHVVIVIILGWRWQTILKSMGTVCRLVSAVDMTFMATFFNLVLPFSIGGDVYRVWLGWRIGIDLDDTVPAAVLDRLTGLLALSLMLLLTAAFLPTSALPWQLRCLMMALLPLIVIFLWLLVTFLPTLRSESKTFHRFRTMSERLRVACSRKGNMLTVFLQSLVAHLVSVIIVVVLAGGLQLDLKIADAFLLVPVMLLAIMMPISLGGWGVREAAAIPLLALAGIPASGAVALALLYGLTQIVSGAAGAMYFSLNTSARARQVRSRRRIAE